MGLEDFKNSRVEAEIRAHEEQMMAKARAEHNKPKYTFFWDGPFSQWATSNFEIDGVIFVTAEQYMMYKKALLFHDYETCEMIMKTTDPREQKAYGRLVKNFNTSVWEKYAKGFVYDGNYAKFTQNDDLLKELLDTDGTTLVEASPYDIIWGIGLKETDPLAQNKETWKGRNWLGEVLTNVRTDIRDHIILNSEQ
jgi:ribA/ribD-fused uncharacterized protein